ncbi:MAG: DUF5318 domain-containing protein [Actinomycetota bacterium]|nr:DUF5318 domain-containing protein [Actinomycetota bacterium]
MPLRPPRSTVGVRSFVDYALVRQATLHDLRSGYVTTTDVCDPHPDLIRAALHHGEPSTRNCPVCRGAELGAGFGLKSSDRLDPRLGINGGPGLPGAGGLVFLRYAYGDELGQFSGRIKSQDELAELSKESGDVKVYVVEVCIACGWNHLIASYVMGDGEVRKAPRRQRTVEDEWGT